MNRLWVLALTACGGSPGNCTAFDFFSPCRHISLMRSFADTMEGEMRPKGHAVSFMLVLKAMVGCSVVAVAAFGLTSPHLGLEPSAAQELAAGVLGAAAGIAIAVRGC